MSVATAAGFEAPHARRSIDGDGRLRGRLKGLVRAAGAGTAVGSSWLGLETAPAPQGSGVAVSLHMAASGGEAALNDLITAGARIANRRGADVEAYLPTAALRALATATGIESARTIIRPVPLATGLGIVGEGVALHKADLWQAAGFTGSGVKVGIIDGGFIGLTARLGRELPATVHARCYREIGLYSSTAKSCEAFTEHGTAVAETIADMAPGVSLYLADPVSALDLESTVAWMTSNGVKVINISLGFAFEGPGDSTAPAGSVYAAVNQAVAGGALWVNAAGNAGEDGWTGTWKDANHNSLLEFSGTDEANSIVLTAGNTIVVSMRWDDTWGRSANDYDLYVFGPTGDFPLAASEDTQNGHGDPVESLSFTPSTSGVYRIEVQRAGGTAASRIQLLVLTSQDSPLEYRVAAGTLPSPADSANPGMLSVGAVAFNAPDVIETYSSRGPTPGGRVKPDLVAADCTTTSLINPFCGTSESAPYVTGAAALALSSRPTLTPAQLATFLKTRAVPLGSPSPNSIYGSGRLDLGAPPTPPVATSLTFTSQPALAVAVAPITPPPTITILDQDGLPLTSGAGATSAVTLALGSGAPTGAVLSCADGLTRNAVAGVATFSGCTISMDASAVTLVASSGALPPVTSAPFDVLPEGSAPAPSILTSATAAAITWGSAVVLSSRLSLLAGAPAAASIRDRSVTFESSTDRSTWRAIGQGTTDAFGKAQLSYRPVTNLYYRATFAGASDLAMATGSTVRVTVRQTLSMRPTNGGATKTVARNQTVTFAATVRPARSDVPPGNVTFEVYRQVGSAWKRVASQVVTPSGLGIAAMSLTFSSPGSWYVRSVASPTPLNANSFWSPAEHYRVP